MICADPTSLCCMFSFMDRLKPVPIKCIVPRLFICDLLKETTLNNKFKINEKKSR